MQAELAGVIAAGLVVSGPQDITMKTLFEAGDYPGEAACVRDTGDRMYSTASDMHPPS